MTSSKCINNWIYIFFSLSISSIIYSNKQCYNIPLILLKSRRQQRQQQQQAKTRITWLNESARTTCTRRVTRPSHRLDRQQSAALQSSVAPVVPLESAALLFLVDTPWLRSISRASRLLLEKYAPLHTHKILLVDFNFVLNKRRKRRFKEHKFLWSIIILLYIFRIILLFRIL